MTITSSLEKSDIFCAIRDFILSEGLYETGTMMDNECKVKKIRIGEVERLKAVLNQAQSQPEEENVLELALDAFDLGDQHSFYGIWDKYVSPNLTKSKKESSTVELEFWIQVYFAIAPIHPFLKQACKIPTSSSMEHFKTFLETKGAEVCKSPQFLAFYALPYIPDPRKHPSFEHLFDDDWYKEIRKQVATTLQYVMDAQGGSLLLQLLLLNEDEKCEQLEKEVLQYQEMEEYFKKRLLSLQRDYRNLITVAADLVEALTSSISGEQITPSYVSRVCQQLKQFKQTSQTFQNQDSRPVSQMSMRPPSSCRSVQNGSLPDTTMNYDFVTIRNELAMEDIQPQAVTHLATLLLALRKNLTEVGSFQERSKFLKDFIKNDVLRVSNSKKSTILTLLSSTYKLIQDQTLKLLNVLASFWNGRDYLLRDHHLIISTLVTLIREENEETTYRENALATLQKLSLRRCAQTFMNDSNVIWLLLDLLSGLEKLTEYTVEYSTALLMNLCLRTSGKLQCKAQMSTLLSTLNEVYELDNLQVRTYINGVYFNILGDGEMREAAKELGLCQFMERMQKKSDESMAHQISYVIDKLNADIEGDEEDNQSEDGYDEEYEDEVDDDYDELCREGDNDYEQFKPIYPPESFLSSHYKRMLPNNLSGSSTPRPTSSLRLSRARSEASRTPISEREVDESILSRPLTPIHRTKTPIPQTSVPQTPVPQWLSRPQSVLSRSITPTSNKQYTPRRALTPA